MGKGVQRKAIEIDSDALEWFANEYPNISLAAVINSLFIEFMNIHIDVGVTPRRVIRDSAKETKEKVDEGVTL